jgi:transposase-like protein
MVFDHRGDYPSQWACITSIAEKFGMTAETLRNWVRQAEIDQGQRPGTTSAEAERIKELECENRELRRANEMRPSRTQKVPSSSRDRKATPRAGFPMAVSRSTGGRGRSITQGLPATSEGLADAISTICRVF